MTLQEDIFFDSGILSSCPFLRKPLLGVADKMLEPRFEGLTKLKAENNGSLSQLAGDALQLESDNGC
jgi:hypothetical protein